MRRSWMKIVSIGGGIRRAAGRYNRFILPIHERTRMIATLAVVAGAYLLGSISFAVVVSRAFRLPDPHAYGSKNPGATNVLRTGHRQARSEEHTSELQSQSH